MQGWEIHVPISPTPGFFSQVHLLAASLRRSGGALAGARTVVTVSRDAAPFDLAAANPWAQRYAIEWRWIDDQVWARAGIFGTALRRFTYDFDAPFVLMLDADTLCTGPLDELTGLADGALAGLVAHISPMGHAAAGEDAWRALFAHAGLGVPALACQHTGWGFMDDDPRRRWCPPYFNLGVLAASRDVMRELGSRVFAEMETVDRHLDTVFRCQLAVTLALARTGIPSRELPLRLNFPNDDRFARAYPGEAADVRILHYLRTEEIDRGELAGSPEQLERLLQRTDLSAMNAFLRDRVAELRDDLLQGLPAHA